MIGVGRQQRGHFRFHGMPHPLPYPRSQNLRQRVLNSLSAEGRKTTVLSVMAYHSSLEMWKVGYSHDTPPPSLAVTHFRP